MNYEDCEGRRIWATTNCHDPYELRVDPCYSPFVCRPCWGRRQSPHTQGRWPVEISSHTSSAAEYPVWGFWKQTSVLSITRHLHSHASKPQTPNKLLYHVSQSIDLFSCEVPTIFCCSYHTNPTRRQESSTWMKAIECFWNIITTKKQLMKKDFYVLQTDLLSIFWM